MSLKFFTNLITALFFFSGVVLIGILPFPLLYGFSNFFSFLLHKVFKYRRSVIVANLTRVYPTLSIEERENLIKQIYRNISDIFLEGLKAFLMPHKHVVKRHRVLNPDIIDPYLKKGISLLGLTGHYSNWEWGSLSASGQIKTGAVALYKKLNNPFVDRFVRASRMKYGTVMAPITETAETFEKYISKTTVFVLAADQNPLRKNLNLAYWVNFFGQKTPFLHGPEKYAKHYNLPVFYIDIQRVRRGYYEILISLLVEDPSKFETGKITEIYANKLQEVISKKPQDWLWSHRRWRYASNEYETSIS
jgi:Kdo2-lipid IVA lauroyltransferase/acyltransferase